jgi:hypothetical protein
VNRYHLTASPVFDTSWGFGAVLMCNMAKHFPTPSGYGSLAPKHLLRAAWDDHGYCIDAPQTMPAGGCYGLDLPPLGDDETPSYMPAQLTVERA